MMSKIKHLLTTAQSSQGLKQSILTIIGDFTAAGLSAIALILFSRILGPSKFGEFSVGVSLVLILARICDAGFTSATLKFVGEKQDKKHLKQLFSLTIYYKTGLCLVVAAVGIIFRAQIAQLLGFPHQDLIVLAFVLGSAFVYYEHLLTMLQSLHLFARGVIVNLIQAFAKMVTAVGLLLTHSTSSFWALAMYLASAYLPILFSKWFLPSWFSFEKTISADLNLKVLKMVRHSSIAFIAVGLIENIDVLFLSKYLTTYDAGLYSGVMRISMVLSLLALSLGNVLNSRVSRYKKAQDRNVFIRKAVVIGLLSVVAFVCFVPFARLLILLSVGPEYLSGIEALIVLGAASFVLLAATPWIALFYTFKSNWFFSLSGIMQLTIVIVGNVVFVPIYGLMATAWIRLVTRVFLLMFSVGLALWMNQRESRKILTLK
jgi:O-antigen/teichoic acid export membrane protein